MKHIVLFKFEKKEFNLMSKLIVETYEKLKNEHKVIEGYDFKLNCVNKDINMDLILFVELKSEDSLPKYINHSDHKIFLDELSKFGISEKAVIDV